VEEYLETEPGKHWIASVQRNSCATDIAHNKGSATMWNLKPERWGALLVQEEKYQGKGTSDKRLGPTQRPIQWVLTAYSPG
jgi:hypothetical protein